MRSIAIIESPLQLISLVEAAHFYSLPFDDLVVIVNVRTKISKLNERCIRETASYFGFHLGNARFIDVSGNKSALFYDRSILQTLTRDLTGVSYRYCFLGEFRSVHARAIVNKLEYRRCVYLDDGNAMTRIAKERYAPRSWRDKMFFSASKIAGLDASPIPKAVFFSAFLDPSDVNRSDEFQRNEFRYLRTQVGASVKGEGASLIVIGSPLSEAGICTVQAECAELDRLFSISKQIANGLPIVYVPHRRESPDKRNWIKEKFKVEMDESLLPVELKLPKYKSCKVIGMYSSCFNTISIIFPAVSIFAVTPNRESINQKSLSFVDAQFAAYKSIPAITVL